MKIAVLFGGISPERNVSIAGGKSVAEALESIGHTVMPIDPAFGALGAEKAKDFIASPENFPTDEELAAFSPKAYIECINSSLFDDIDLAFLVLHGTYGEDGTIQALLQLRGIPYTGSGIKASSVAIDKLASKLMFLAAGISTPNWLTVREEHFDDMDFVRDLRSELGQKVVIKANCQGSSIGISIVLNGNLDDMLQGIKDSAKYDETVIVEQYIPGRELTVGIIDGEALPIIEIVPEEGYYDYKHKYTKGHTEYICPAEIDENLSEFIQSLAVTAFDVLGCKGFARADFRLSEDNQPFLLEVNTIPGFTSTSLVPKAAKETGIDFPELCDKIANMAVNHRR